MVRRDVAQPAYRRVAEQLQAMVESGELQPGHQLLPERKLAELFAASRTSVREALAALSGAGVIELTGQGAVVRQRDVEQISGAFGALVAQERSDVLEMLETREIIEARAAEYAAVRCSLSDLHRLSMYAQEIEDAIARRADAADPDTNFHLALVACAKNHVLSQVFAVLDGGMRYLYQPTRRIMLLDESLASAFLAEHWGIIDALRRHDRLDAAVLVRSHIGRALEFVRRSLEEQEPRG